MPPKFRASSIAPLKFKPKEGAVDDCAVHTTSEGWAFRIDGTLMSYREALIHLKTCFTNDEALEYLDLLKTSNSVTYKEFHEQANRGR